MLQAFNQNHQHLHHHHHHHHHHQTTKANSWTLLKTTSVFFYLIFTIICFPTLSKKFFWKKLKNVNVTSHHQAIINNNIIIRSWNSEQSNAQKPNFWRRTFTTLSGLVENLLGNSQKILPPLPPPRSTKKRHVFQILDIF